MHLLARVWRMDDVAVAGVQRDMFDAGVKEDQVTVPEIGLGDLLANAVLLSGRMRQLTPAAFQAFMVRPEQSQPFGPAALRTYAIAELFFGECQSFLALGVVFGALETGLGTRFLGDDGRRDDLAGLQ